MFLAYVPLTDFSVALEPRGALAGRTAVLEPCLPRTTALSSAHLVLKLTEREAFTVLTISRSETLNPVLERSWHHTNRGRLPGGGVAT